jgi:DNA-binding NtrC family response regulator
MAGDTTISIHEHTRGSASAHESVPALLLAWSHAEPERVGEVVLVERSLELGREGASFVRQRPASLSGTTETGSLRSPAISRKQLRVVRRGQALAIEQLGRCPLLVDGAVTTRCIVEPGDVLELQGQLVLLCTERPRELEPTRELPRESLGAFGEPDAFGMVGESPAAWDVREQLAFAAHADAHVLVLGQTGTGKELAARAIHGLSARADGPFIARNAATLPAGLVDAELFGNLRNYPNPGMQERVGLVGEAHGGTLFLDELGELAAESQAHLLRVLDAGGEYHRLGEGRPRRSTFRFVGATNRGARELKHDLTPRLPLRVELPSLALRRDDLPLFVGHLLARAHARSPELVGRFRRHDGSFALSPALMVELLRAPLEANVRELDALLWEAMAQSRGDTLRPAPRPQVEARAPELARAPSAAAPAIEPSADELRAAIEAQRGNVVRAAAALGLPSRYALYRLLKKHGIDPDAARAGA